MRKSNDLVRALIDYRHADRSLKPSRLPVLVMVLGISLSIQAFSANSQVHDQVGVTAAPGAEIIGRLPAGHFLENIAQAPDGSFWVTDYVGRAVYRYSPEDGFRHFMELGVHPADVAFAEDGTAFVTAQTDSALNSSYRPSNVIVQINPDGAQEQITGPGVFFNGIAALGNDQFVIADSGTDTLWAFDANDREIAALIRDQMLAKSDVRSLTPGANGVQIHDGYLYVSNSERAILMRFPLPLRADSVPEILIADTVIDDFTFKADGTLLATSHGDNVFQIDLTTGLKTIVAGVDDGVRGSTSVVIEADGRSGLVVTDGGLFQGGLLGTANLVRVPIE